MTAAEYRVAIGRLGLTQNKAADAVGVKARTSRRWARGGILTPEISAEIARRLSEYEFLDLARTTIINSRTGATMLVNEEGMGR